MISKDEILNAIMKFTGGSSSKEFTKTNILTELGKKSQSKTVDKIFEELVNEGIITLNRTRGNAKYYVLSKKVESEKEEKKTVEKTDSQNPIKEIVDEVIKKYFEEYFGKPKTFEDLDKVYEQVKDDVGYASITDLRIQLGMSLEQFMSKFRDYIIKNYELISGGKEGLVIHGTMYGIIRRKV